MGREITFKDRLQIEKKINILDLKVDYYLSKDDSIRRTLVFIHGYSSNHNYFVTLYARLFSDIGYNFLAFSLPGHGNSTTPGKEFGFKQQVAISKLLIEKLVPNQKIYLHGHSMGGAIVLALCTQKGLNIEDVVVVSPLNRTSISKRIILNKYYLPLTFKDARKLVSLIYHEGGSYIKSFHSLSNLMSDLKWIWENPDRTSYLNALLNDLLKEETMDLIDQGIKRLGAKLTLFFGTSDGLIDLLNIVDYFLDLNPEIKIYPRPQTGHTPWIEDPVFYRKWLTKHYEKK